MCSQWVLMCKAFPTLCWRFRKVQKTLTLAWEIRKFKKRGKSPNHISSLLETLPTPTRPQAPRKVFTTAWTPNAVSCVRSPGMPLWAPAPWISSAIWRAGRTEVWGWWCGSTAFPITQVDFASVTPNKSNTSLPSGSFPRPCLPALPLCVYPVSSWQLSAPGSSSLRATQTQATQGCLRKFGTVTLTYVLRCPYFPLGEEWGGNELQGQETPFSFSQWLL